MTLLFAASYPEQVAGLVIIGGYARRMRAPDYPWGPTLEGREKYLEDLAREWGGPFGLEARAPSRSNDPQFREWWATYLRMGASPGAALTLSRMNSEVDVRDILPTVHVPTLLIHRTGDRSVHSSAGPPRVSSPPGRQ